MSATNSSAGTVATVADSPQGATSRTVYATLTPKNARACAAFDHVATILLAQGQAAFPHDFIELDPELPEDIDAVSGRERGDGSSSSDEADIDAAIAEAPEGNTTARIRTGRYKLDLCADTGTDVPQWFAGRGAPASESPVHLWLCPSDCSKIRPRHVKIRLCPTTGFLRMAARRAKHPFECNGSEVTEK